eukprot:224427-Rhodomonas_salina.2
MSSTTVLRDDIGLPTTAQLSTSQRCGIAYAATLVLRNVRYCCRSLCSYAAPTRCPVPWLRLTVTLSDSLAPLSHRRGHRAARAQCQCCGLQLETRRLQTVTV